MPYEFGYNELTTLHRDHFADGFDLWHHEGVGRIEPSPDPGPRATAGMRLHCAGSAQGREGCMAFFRPTLPDQIAIEYDLTVRSHGGLVINYLAIRGIQGEDLIDDRDKLPPRTGIMANYYSRDWGLQSYHVSVSRFNDAGEHTGTCNWRRNPGLYLVGHGVDMLTNLHRTYRVRVEKDRGHCQLFVDGVHAHGFVDRDESRMPIPDHGKFGFRLIGSDVKVDIANFAVHQLEPNPRVWRNDEDRHFSPSPGA